MIKLKEWMDRGLGIVCTAIFFLMTVVGTYQIITRYVFNAPSTVSEELLTYSFTWLALLSAAFVFGKRDHMRMAYFADKVEGSNRMLLNLLSEIFVLGFAALILIFGGIAITKLTMTQITASLGIPMGYVYMVLPVSGVLIVIYSIINIAQLLKENKDSGEVQS